MDTYLLIIILLIAISCLISIFGSIVGFGGGIFMVPILITIFHYPLEIAVGSVMVSLIPSSLLSTYINRKQGFVDFRMGILLEIPTIVGVILGSLMLSFLSSERLEILFALMVFLLGISFFLKIKSKTKRKIRLFYHLNKMKPRMIIKNPGHFVAYRISIWMIGFFGFLSGSLAGLFGIGGGFMKTPIMIKVFKIPAKIAAATALFMIVITSFVGSISHYLQGHVDFVQAWPIIVGFAFGALAGQRLNVKIKDKVLEKMIGFALLLASLVMLSNFVING